MKVNVEETGPCRRVMTVDAPPEATAKEYDELVAAYASAGKVPGFRAGKAPAGVAEKHYAKRILDEAKERLLPTMYQQALKEADVAPLAVLNVEDVVFTKAEGMSFKVTFDVAPTFKLPKYKKISLKAETVAVSDKDVDEAVDRLLDGHARFEDVEGRPVQSGDLVLLDYEGTCDGVRVTELGEDTASVGQGTDFWAMVGEPEFLPGMAEALVGLVAGEEKTLSVSFPDDFRVAAMQGKTAEYVVTAKKLREKVKPELTEAFLKPFEVESEAALRERIRTEMVQGREQGEKNRLKEEITKHLVEKSSFEAPESLVEREAQAMVRSMVSQIAQQGGSREELAEQYHEIMSAANDSAGDRVKVSFILERIADEEDVEVSDADVDGRIAQMAMSYRMEPGRMKADLEKNERLDALRQEVRAEKTLDRILELAKIKGWEVK